MKIAVEHVPQIHGGAKGQKQEDFLRQGEGFQNIILQLLSFMAVVPSNAQEGMEHSNEYTKMDMKPVEAQIKSCLPENRAVDTMRTQFESDSSLEGGANVAEDSHRTHNFLEHQRKKLEIVETIKVFNGSAEKEVFSPDPMKKLMEGIERIQQFEGGGKDPKPKQADKDLLEVPIDDHAEDMGIKLENKSMLDKKWEISSEQQKSAQQNKSRHKNLTNNLGGTSDIPSIKSDGVLESSPQKDEIQNFKEVVSRMVEEIKELESGGQSVLKVKLKPEGLGEMEVKLELKAGEITGKILVDNLTAKGALDSQMEHLKVQLKLQNIVLQEVDIDLQSPQQGGSQGHGYRPPQQDKDHFGLLNSTRDHTREWDEVDDLTKGKLQSKVYYSKTYSSSLNLLA